MKRRYFVGSALFAISAVALARYTVMIPSVPSPAPTKVLLIPDRWQIKNVGRLGDGSLYLVDGQLDSDGRSTRDFVCTFIFDADGELVEHSIELIGTRGAYPDNTVGLAVRRHLAALGNRVVGRIWVRPFSVQRHGTTFGLIPRQTEFGDWRVEFMPGNTLSFYAPWGAGGYDT